LSGIVGIYRHLSGFVGICWDLSEPHEQASNKKKLPGCVGICRDLSLLVLDHSICGVSKLTGTAISKKRYASQNSIKTEAEKQAMASKDA